jgi:hypothetical protein
MASERKMSQEFSIFVNPTIVINNVTYRGDIEADAVLTAV